MGLGDWLARRRARNHDLLKRRIEAEVRLQMLAEGIDPDAPGPQGPAGVQGPRGLDLTVEAPVETEEELVNHARVERREDGLYLFDADNNLINKINWQGGTNP